MWRGVMVHRVRYKLHPPDLAELGRNHSELRAHLTYNSATRAFVDWKNPLVRRAPWPDACWTVTFASTRSFFDIFGIAQSLRAVTYALLREHFGLTLELPVDHLVPAVPLRLNYIHWIEDLLTLAGRAADEVVCSMETVLYSTLLSCGRPNRCRTGAWPM